MRLQILRLVLGAILSHTFINDNAKKLIYDILKKNKCLVGTGSNTMIVDIRSSSNFDKLEICRVDILDDIIEKFHEWVDNYQKMFCDRISKTLLLKYEEFTQNSLEKQILDSELGSVIIFDSTGKFLLDTRNHPTLPSCNKCNTLPKSIQGHLVIDGTTRLK